MKLDEKFLEIESSIKHTTKENRSLKFFFASLKNLINEIVKKHDLNEENFLEVIQNKLPIITYSDFEKPPFLLSFTAINQGENTHGVGRFIADMLSNWLIPGKQLQISGNQSLNFKFSNLSKNKFYVTEYFLYVENEKDLENIKFYIDDFINRLRIIILSVYKARYILLKKNLKEEEKSIIIKENISMLLDKKDFDLEENGFDQMQHFMLKLSFENNISKVRENINKLFYKRPRFTDRYTYEDFCRVGRFFGENFVAKRDPKYVSKIFSYHYLLKKGFKHTVDKYPNKRHITIKFIKKGSKIGIILFLNLLKETENFEKKHLIEAIKSCVTNISYIENSIIEDKEKNRIVSIFLEVEKKGESLFSIEELKSLKKNIFLEIKGRIEKLINPVFMPRNDEEIMRNIVLLSDQIKYVGDIPQIIINYDNQNDEKLFFLVILVRLLKKGTSSIEDDFLYSNTKLKFISEDVKEIGIFKKKHKKEANTFKIAINKNSFYRKDFSLDLQKAKQFILKELTNVIGHYRDFHGGMLSMQKEAYENLKVILKNYSDESAIEQFFYSIKPSIMQSIVKVEVLKKMFLLLNKTLKKEIKNFSVETISEKNYLLLVVRSREYGFEKKIETVLKDLDISLHDMIFCKLKNENILVKGYILRCDDLKKHSFFYHVFLKMMDDWFNQQDFSKKWNVDMKNFISNFSGKILKDKEFVKKDKRNLKISLQEDPVTLDPRKSSDGVSSYLLFLLYNGLMEFKEDGQVVPSLTKSYKISSDEKTYVFYLKDNIKWSNGKEITAYDFEASWKKMLDPTFSSISSHLLFPILNAEKAKKGKVSLDKVGIKAEDRKTLVIKLKCPTPYFLSLISFSSLFPIPFDLEKSVLDKNLVSSGPFVLKKWIKGKEILLEKNRYYWNKENIFLDSIHISILKNVDERIKLFQEGKLDWSGALIPFFSKKVMKFFVSEERKDKKQLRISLQMEPLSIDPRKSSDLTSSSLLFMLYNGLMEFKEDGSVVPSLAKSYEISSDGKQYIFYLKDNIKWSNGKDITAYDFEASWKKMLDPKFSSLSSHLLYPILNAENAKPPFDEVGIKAVDKKVLIVKLKNPTSHFLSLTSFCSLFPIPSFVKDKISGKKNIVSSGPFILKKWIKGKEILLEKNPYYWNSEDIHLNSIHISIIKDETKRLEMFQNGKLDWAGSLISPFPIHIDYLTNNRKEKIASVGGTTFCSFNTNMFPFNNKNIRKAFGLAINRKKIVEIIEKEKDQIAYRCIPPFVMKAKNIILFKDNDLKKAKELFEKGLKELNVQAEDLKITFSYEDAELYQVIADIIKNGWENSFSIPIKLEKLESAVIKEKLHNQKLQTSLAFWVMHCNDPMNILERFKYKNNKKNYSAWENKPFTELLEKISFLKDKTKFIEKAEKLLIDEMPVSPIYHHKYLMVMKPNVKGIYVGPVGNVCFDKAKIES